ncbi:MAG: PBP1A family penicillin-binding protein [Burkholderiales bacterium]|nr:PBP1A family penicillin-binding protein [Burkholderiales bacterium]
MLKRWLIYIASVVGGVLLVGGVLGALVWALISARLPSLDVLTDYQPKLPLRVLSEDGVLLAEFGEERRSLVKLAEVPVHVRQAILAAEDANFYEHGGVDWLAMLRVAYANTFSGSKFGGSTITMQVARNFFLTRERSGVAGYLRKANEVALTFKIEHELTKDQILELYINQIYLGQRAYGFAAAARAYYGKPLDKISVAEAAMLAGLPKAPSSFNPFVNPKRAALRQQYVLRRMHELNFLNDHDYKLALDAPSTLKNDTGPTVHSEYLNEMVRQFVFDLVGEMAYTRGLTVTTTIKARDQEAAYQALRRGVLDYERRQAFRGPEGYVELPPAAKGGKETPADAEALTEAIDAGLARFPDADDLLAAIVLEASPKRVVVTRGEGETYTLEGDAIRFVRAALSDSASSGERLRRGAVLRLTLDDKGLPRLTQMPQVEAALVAIDPKDGAVRSLVGGFDFNKNQYNHVTQASRQPGSSFKPFIYSAALEKGITPTTVINDAPLYFPGSQTGGDAWEPKNYDGKFEGPMRVRTALAKSKNMVSIRVLRAIGPSYAQDYITRFGFDPKQHPAYLTLALGAGQTNPMQMAAAYSVFANGGFRIKPYFIRKILDPKGTVIFEESPVVAGKDAEQAIDPRNAFIMTTMLRDVVRFGTAAKAMSLGRGDLAGKTGTTNDSVDAWFAGFDQALVAVAWVGFDQPKSLGERETGGGVALPIWMNYMKVALKGVPEVPLKPPPGVVNATIGSDEGLVDAGGTSDWFYSEFPPRRFIDPLTGNEGSRSKQDEEVRQQLF